MPASLGKLKRVAGMSPAEVRFRVRQQIQNRFEGLLHSIGIQPGTDLLKEKAPAANPQFFFSRGERAEIAAIAKDRMPGEVEQVIQRAEKICAHRFDLLGSKDL